MLSEVRCVSIRRNNERAFSLKQMGIELAVGVPWHGGCMVPGPQIRAGLLGVAVPLLWLDATTS